MSDSVRCMPAINGVDGNPGLDLSVVIPVYNEAGILEETMARLLSWLGEIPYLWELILVDDGSTDSSRQIMEKLFGETPAVRVLGYSPNRGRGHALSLGMRSAQGAVVLTTEADLSWDTVSMGHLVGMVHERKADVAVASPYRPGGRLVGVPPSRVALSRIANLLAKTILRGGITMATGMTRAYRREILDLVLSTRQGKEFHLDVLCRSLRRRLVIREVPAVVSWQNAADVPLQPRNKEVSYEQ